MTTAAVSVWVCQHSVWLTAHLSVPVQKTADFLTNNKLGHCVKWNTALPEGGEGVLPPYSPPAASPGSKQHAVS